MLSRAMSMAKRNGYDLVHAVEESVFMAMRIRRRFGVPYVYDMDSSMPRQIVAGIRLLRPLLPFMTGCEKRAVAPYTAHISQCTVQF